MLTCQETCLSHKIPPVSIGFVHKCLILQLARSRHASAVAKSRKCKHAASRSRQRPGSIPGVQGPQNSPKGSFSAQKPPFFLFPQNGFPRRSNLRRAHSASSHTGYERTSNHFSQPIWSASEGKITPPWQGLSWSCNCGIQPNLAT